MEKESDIFLQTKLNPDTIYARPFLHGSPDFLSLQILHVLVL